AVEAAEQSAAQGRARESLTAALMGALETAGAALAGLYGFPGSEPRPADGNAATVASFVAKVAEMAAPAALAAGGEAAAAAAQAQALGLARIGRQADRGGWTDRSAVAAARLGDRL